MNTCAKAVSVLARRVAVDPSVRPAQLTPRDSVKTRAKSTNLVIVRLLLDIKSLVPPYSLTLHDRPKDCKGFGALERRSTAAEKSQCEAAMVVALAHLRHFRTRPREITGRLSITYMNFPCQCIHL